MGDGDTQPARPRAAMAARGLCARASREARGGDSGARPGAATAARGRSSDGGTRSEQRRRRRLKVPISVPSSSSLETILSPDLMYNNLQLKEVNHNATAMDESTEFFHLILSGNDEGYNTTSEFQVWDVLDFYFPESFSAVQFDSLMGFTNDVTTSYDDCMNIVDMVERPVALLSLDETEEPNNTTDEAPVDHTTMYPDDTSLYLQMKPSDSETESTSASRDVVGTEYVDEKLLSVGLPDLMDVDSPNRLPKSPVRTKYVLLCWIWMRLLYIQHWITVTMLISPFKFSSIRKIIQCM